jgi:glucosamine--fructose-6-phosphate aminotransferase (isomerizing)
MKSFRAEPMSNMLEETRQQPQALTKTLESGLRAIFELRHHFESHRPRLIIMVARGTSDNAAQFGRYLIEITTRIPVSLAAPSILTLYECPLDLRDVLVVGISQSGESTDTNAVLADARERGATTIGITNEAGSAMAKLVEYPLLIQAGGEKSVAATKTYTCQLMMVYLLAYALSGDVQLDDLRRVPEWADAALRLEEDIEDLAERYFFMTRAVTVGRGLNYANALEFGLKLMETCYVVTERFSAADLMHGPIALVERAFPVFVFAPSGVTWPSISAVLDRLRELKAETLIITDESNAAARSKAARLIQLPAQFKTGIEDLYTPIPYIVPVQLFAAHLASIKGLNADSPRTLSKITRTM